MTCRIVLTCLFSLWATVVGATDRYVDNTTSGCSIPTDTDYSPVTESCGSGSELVYRTIAAALAAESANDNIYIRAGTYAEGIADTIASGTGPGFTATTSLIGWPGETVTITGTGAGSGCQIWISNSRTNITVRNITFNASACTAGATVRIGNSSNPSPRPSYIRFQQVNVIDNAPSTGFLAAADNFEVTNSVISGNGDSTLNHGIYWSAGTVGTFRHNQLLNNSGTGIQFYPISTQAVFEYNLCKGNGGVCVAMGGDTETIRYNVMIANSSNTRMLQLTTGSQTVRNSIVAHNVFYRAGTASGNAFLKTRSGTLTASNNIAIGFSTAFSDTSSTWTLVDNLTSGTATDIWTSPSTDNFTLKSGSAAIDAGTAIGGAANGAPDQGAHEVPKFSTCSVETGATSVVRVTFTNNLNPPMLPSSSVTGVTFRKNGSNNAVISSTRISDNVYGFTVTNSYAGGDTVNVSIVPASTNLTDSALIGNTSNQPFISTITNQACTNNLSGAPSHTYTQARYELHGWRGLEDAPDILPHGFPSTGAAENFPNYKVYPGAKLRVRFVVVCGVVDCPKTTFHPYFSTGGAYAPITDDFSVNDIKMCGIPSGADMPANAVPTTAQLSTGGTFVPGGIVFTANDVPEVDGLKNGYKTEMEYCVETDTDASGYFDLRLYLDSGAALNVYTSIATPRLVVAPVSAGGM